MEVVVLVGMPGAGKTTYARSEFPGHAYVSIDHERDRRSWTRRRRLLIARYDAELPVRLGGLSGNKKAECVMVGDALAAGRSVVVDDTNLTRAVRRPYVALARTHGARIRAVFFADHEGARSRNAARPDGDGRVPEGAVAEMLDTLEPPASDEGFAEIVKIF